MLRPRCCDTQGSALASLAYTPDSNVLDAFWQRTAAILAETPDQADDDLELDDEEDEQGAKTASSAAAQALAAAQREAIAGPGRLVALQVCTEIYQKSSHGVADAWCNCLQSCRNAYTAPLLPMVIAF